VLSELRHCTFEYTIVPSADTIPDDQEMRWHLRLSNCSRLNKVSAAIGIVAYRKQLAAEGPPNQSDESQSGDLRHIEEMEADIVLLSCNTDNDVRTLCDQLEVGTSAPQLQFVLFSIRQSHRNALDHFDFLVANINFLWNVYLKHRHWRYMVYYIELEFRSLLKIALNDQNCKKPHIQSLLLIEVRLMFSMPA
jgi:hypothetical protein